MDTKSTTVRDVFLHLLSIVALYLVSYAFGSLLFSIVNTYFPDALDYRGSEYEAIRIALATIIIVFPLYIWVMRFLVRARQAPEYVDVRIRRWLIYLTLSLATIAIASDLVTLLYYLLGGELTIRFILKALAVLVLAAAVFYYYLWELRTHVRGIRIFVWTTCIVVVLAVIYGLFLIGSPFYRRALRFDERRVQDLQNIQYQIVNYWQRKRVLPTQLDDLREDISGSIPPRDPATDAPYEYRPVNEQQFELCATFETTGTEKVELALPYNKRSEPSSDPNSEPVYWSHTVGRTCFTRTIDIDFYPPLPKPVKP